MSEKKIGFITKIVELFLQGPLSILVIVIALLLGAIAIFSTPREEEPQIVVPTADISVSYPGHSAAEVEKLVTTPLEKLVWQIDGVEHVYSISKKGGALVTVRFYVGEDRERSIIKLRDKIEANKDQVPQGVRNWIIKPVEIDDVPIVTLTLFSDTLNSYELRRVAEEFKARLEKIKNISRTEIFGGDEREIRIEPNIEKMASMHISFNDIINALRANNVSQTAGSIVDNNKSRLIQVSGSLKSVEDIKKTVIPTNLHPEMKINNVEWMYKTLYSKSKKNPSNKIVRIEDIAKVTDGPALPDSYLSIGFGPASKYFPQYKGKRLSAVTLTFSKKRGTNAVDVAQNILQDANHVKQEILPSDVKMIVTRNYGEIANDKVNGLIESMIFAIITVVALLYFTMGWRESLVVGLAVPVSFAMALFVNYLFGYTINRVTLFALILSLGLVVDDPITNVDNIQRHIMMGVNKPFKATLIAVQEVLPPVIMSTLAIIVCFTPMFFITGMMGPYMGPMAINVPLTVTFSTVCAVTFVPWLAYKLLKSKAPQEGVMKTPGKPINTTPQWIKRLYRKLLSPLLEKKGRSFLFLGIIFVLMIVSAGLLLWKVPLKMLPFDNKDELQLIVDMPEGTPLEVTDRFNQELESYLKTVNEIKDFETYTGLNSPVDFNGLIRHYNLRRQPHNADIRINLASKYKRSQQSHAIGLRLREDITKIADKYNAKVKIVEVPPGPPVISTITAEIRGKSNMDYSELIKAAKMLQTRLKDKDPVHIVEIDDMAETPHDELTFKIDRNKLASNDFTASEVYDAISTAVGGKNGGIAHVLNERNPLLINVRLPIEDRSDEARLKQIWIKNYKGKQVQLSELGKFEKTVSEQPVYHKNMERVVYVTAECAGKAPGKIIVDMMSRLKENPLPKGIKVEWAGEGEWEITLRVFIDLGIAFGIALIGIYLLMTVQMKSFFMPMIVMMAIPLTIIGISPGFYLLNLFAGGNVGLYPDPIFFTATAMIGMIALGGIVIRNSIVLIEFVQDSVNDGQSLKDALLESGAVRFRPIVLTALTTMLGAWPITFDPVFSGLAWSLIFGLISSTIFTLLVIPVVYYLVMSKFQHKSISESNS